MQRRSHAETRAGPGEKPNQDRFLLDEERGLYAVSDGLGAYKGGEVASRLVVEAVDETLRAPAGEDVAGWLRNAVKRAAKAVYEAGKEERRFESMAATLTLLHLSGESYSVIQIGDSRAYRLRAGSLEQLTQDHSVAFEQYLAGAITKEQIAAHPNQKLLTRTITAGRNFAVSDLFLGDVQEGDRFLVCSDGLNKVLADADLQEILSAAGDPEEACARLLDAAIEQGCDDDVTAVVVYVDT
jgi:protein phosphatase